MSIDWNACAQYANETAKKIKSDTVIFAQQQKERGVIFLSDVYTENGPPLIILSFTVQATDLRRAELYDDFGQRHALLNESERNVLGDFVGQIVKRYNLVCSKGYCRQNARMVYYIKPRYGDFERSKQK